MMKKYIKPVSFMAVALLMTSFITVSGNTKDKGSIDAAFVEKQILGANTAILKDKEEQQELKRLWDEAEDDDNKNKIADNFYDTKMNARYYPISTKNAYTYGEWNLSQLEESKVNEGLKYYYDYVQTVEEIELHKAKLERLQGLVDQAQVKVNLGTATISTLEDAQLAVKQEFYLIEGLKNTRDYNVFNLNLLMNYDIDTELDIAIEQPIVEKFTVEDIQADIDNVIANNGEIVKMKQDQALEEEKLKIYNELDSLDSGTGTNLGSKPIYGHSMGKMKNDSNIEKSEHLIKDKDYSIADKKRNLEYTVRSKYNTLQNKYDDILIKEYEVENLEMSYEIAVKRFDVGLETQNTVDVAKENLDMAKLSLQKVKTTYYLAVVDYKNYVD